MVVIHHSLTYSLMVEEVVEPTMVAKLTLQYLTEPMEVLVVEQVVLTLERQEHHFQVKDLVVEQTLKVALKMVVEAVEPAKQEEVMTLMQHTEQKVVMVFLHLSTELQLTTEVVVEPVYGETLEHKVDVEVSEEAETEETQML